MWSVECVDHVMQSCDKHDYGYLVPPLMGHVMSTCVAYRTFGMAHSYICTCNMVMDSLSAAAKIKSTKVQTLGAFIATEN